MCNRENGTFATDTARHPLTRARLIWSLALLLSSSVSWLHQHHLLWSLWCLCHYYHTETSELASYGHTRRVEVVPWSVAILTRRCRAVNQIYIVLYQASGRTVSVMPRCVVITSHWIVKTDTKTIIFKVEKLHCASTSWSRLKQTKLIKWHSESAHLFQWAPIL